MSVTGVNGGTAYSVYPPVANSNRTEQDDFTEALEVASENEEEFVDSEKTESKNSKFTIQDLFSRGRPMQIPVINKIVNAKNPVDGKIYVTYFTDDQISCNDAAGNRVWDLKIDEKNKDTVNDFFSNYKPDRDIVKEYYSNRYLGQVANKDFWLSMFK